MRSRIATVVAATSWLLVAGWMAGRLLSDQWGWSQWLAWMPTLILAALLLPATGVQIAAGRRIGAALLAVVTLLLAGWFMLIENRPFGGIEPRGDLRLVAWTMSHSKERAAQHAAQLIALDADITVMTHGYIVRGQEEVRQWLGPRGKRLINGPFTVLTRLRPIEVRTLIASGGIHVSMFHLDPRPLLDRKIVLWAIDLPSSFNEPRIDMARRARRLLDEVNAPRPDVVVGDFNMDRNSAAVRALFPDMVDAWSEAGSGFSASYHRVFPLWDIDHVLLGESLKAVSSVRVDPGIGRHRMQVVGLVTPTASTPTVDPAPSGN